MRINQMRKLTIRKTKKTMIFIYTIQMKMMRNEENKNRYESESGSDSIDDAVIDEEYFLILIRVVEKLM